MVNRGLELCEEAAGLFEGPAEALAVDMEQVGKNTKRASRGGRDEVWWKGIRNPVVVNTRKSRAHVMGCGDPSVLNVQKIQNAPHAAFQL